MQRVNDTILTLNAGLMSYDYLAYKQPYNQKHAHVHIYSHMNASANVHIYIHPFHSRHAFIIFLLLSSFRNSVSDVLKAHFKITLQTTFNPNESTYSTYLNSYLKTSFCKRKIFFQVIIFLFPFRNNKVLNNFGKTLKHTVRN